MNLRLSYFQVRTYSCKNSLYKLQSSRMPLMTWTTEMKIFGLPLWDSGLYWKTSYRQKSWLIVIVPNTQVFCEFNFKKRLCNHRVMFFFYVCNIFLMYKDPVCNMMVDEKKTEYVSQTGGRNVYLCSAACKSEFEKNSSKYGY